MYSDPGCGYHVDKTQGVAVGNEPESIYAVMSGTNYNGRCCFDCKDLDIAVDPELASPTLLVAALW